MSKTNHTPSPGWISSEPVFLIKHTAYRFAIINWPS
jgi:hypothetical protein